MNSAMYIGFAVGGVLLLCLLIWLLAKKRHIFISAAIGLLLLALVNQTSGITGVGLGYNLMTVSSAALLGPPGVALLLMCNLL